MAFKKGKSGNPSGRPKQDPSIKALCQAAGPEIIQIALEKIKNEKTPEAVRARYIEIVLDRGFGKSIQPTKDLGQGESWDEVLAAL